MGRPLFNILFLLRDRPGSAPASYRGLPYLNLSTLGIPGLFFPNRSGDPWSIAYMAPCGVFGGAMIALKLDFPAQFRCPKCWAFPHNTYADRIITRPDKAGPLKTRVPIAS